MQRTIFIVFGMKLQAQALSLSLSLTLYLSYTQNVIHIQSTLEQQISQRLNELNWNVGQKNTHSYDAEKIVLHWMSLYSDNKNTVFWVKTFSAQIYCERLAE